MRAVRGSAWFVVFAALAAPASGATPQILAHGATAPVGEAVVRPAANGDLMVLWSDGERVRASFRLNGGPFLAGHVVPGLHSLDVRRSGVRPLITPTGEAMVTWSGRPRGHARRARAARRAVLCAAEGTRRQRLRRAGLQPGRPRRHPRSPQPAGSPLPSASPMGAGERPSSSRPSASATPGLRSATTVASSSRGRRAATAAHGCRTPPYPSASPCASPCARPEAASGRTSPSRPRRATSGRHSRWSTPPGARWSSGDT